MSEPRVPHALRVLLVDDEPAALANLRRLLAAVPNVEIVGECDDGRSAVERIARGGIDVVLLDVQMPELDGFGVVRAVGVDAMPTTVFVTAYDEYAIAAFEVYAAGYLLKPVTEARLTAQFERLRRATSGVDDTPIADLARLLDEMRPRQTIEHLAIRTGGRVVFVPTRDIDWIEAANVQVAVHAGGRRYTMRESLTELERLLSPREFARVHRSAIVRIDRIREMQPWFKGEYVIILTSGAKVTTGRSYRSRVEELLRHR